MPDDLLWFTVIGRSDGDAYANFMRRLLEAQDRTSPAEMARAGLAPAASSLGATREAIDRAVAAAVPNASRVGHYRSGPSGEVFYLNQSVRPFLNR
jgi:hypothetical protein